MNWRFINQNLAILCLILKKINFFNGTKKTLAPTSLIYSSVPFIPLFQVLCQGVKGPWISPSQIHGSLGSSLGDPRAGKFGKDTLKGHSTDAWPHPYIEPV